MKIGIFGDSFSSPTSTIDFNEYLGWVELLSQDYNVTNFSENGASLYYEKCLFDKNHKNFDQIIFCITEPGRLTYTVESVFVGINEKKYPSYLRHLPGIRSVTNRINLPGITHHEKEKYKIIYNWMLHIQDMEYESYVHNLMVNDIINQRPSAIIIPCFPSSIKGIDESLSKITAMEDIAMKRKGSYNDFRKCHLCPENNFLIYKLIKEALINNKNKIDLSIEQFYTPSLDKDKLYSEDSV